MHYEEQSRRLALLGGFALGAAVGVAAGLLLAPAPPVPEAAAVARARGLRGPSGRKHARRGAAGRMARRRFRL